MYGKVFVLLSFFGAMYLVAQARLDGECYLDQDCLSAFVPGYSFYDCCGVLQGGSHRSFGGLCQNW